MSTKKKKRPSLLVPIFRITALLIFGISIIFPSILFDWHAKQKICFQWNQGNTQPRPLSNENDGILQMLNSDKERTCFCKQDVLHHLCAKVMGHPSVYGLVQSKYWGVGLLRFYRLKQLPNFLLGLPVLLCSVRFIWRQMWRRVRSDVLVSDFGARGSEIWKYMLIFCSCPHTIHLLIASLVALLWAHVQISTRLLLSSCPILYVALADQARGSSIQCSYLTHVFVFSYFIVGVVAHVNWFPWT
jgi:Gpi18-like mannosyltransferase